VPQTVVVVDDHAGFRVHAAEMLEAAGFAVVGSCADGRSALAAITDLRPDVVLLDVQMPDLDGFAVLARLDAAARGRVVLVSTREQSDYGNRVRDSGAAGFITKGDLSPATVARAVPGP
jgi:two-component system nitrate/nitrite response regulator NarL